MKIRLEEEKKGSIFIYFTISKHIKMAFFINLAKKRKIQKQQQQK